MQLWVSRSSDIPISRQIATQIILGILGGDLAPGQRLPSTRALARRFRIHPNTVGAGYRELEREGWLEGRKGSGVFVRRTPPASETGTAEMALDRAIASLFRSARRQGIGLLQLRSRLAAWLAMQPPDRFLVIEPDEELRRIVIHEMQSAVTLTVLGCDLEACRQPAIIEGAIPVALPSKVESVRALLPAGVDLIGLHVRSVPASLQHYLPAPSAALVGIASRWDAFLTLGQTMLIAAGFHPDCLVLCDAKAPNWQQHLKRTTAVVCDSLTAVALELKSRIVPYYLLTEESLAELRRSEHFVAGAGAELFLQNVAVAKAPQDPR